MSTIELRQKLINKINQTEDNNLLEEALRLLDHEDGDLGIVELNDQQIAAIDEAKEQIKRGQYLTHEQASKEIGEWLSK